MTRHDPHLDFGWLKLLLPFFSPLRKAHPRATGRTGRGLQKLTRALDLPSHQPSRAPGQHQAVPLEQDGPPTGLPYLPIAQMNLFWATCSFGPAAIDVGSAV